MRERQVGLLGCLFLFAAALFSETPRRVTRIDVERGLSQNTVNCMLQDSEGYLWFGTQNGLNRFDGYEVTVFKKEAENPQSLSHSIIRCLYEDSQQQIWVGTEGGGLNRYDRKTETFVRYRYQPENPQSIGSDHVYAILEDSAGRFWIGTFGGGLNQMNQETGVFTRLTHNDSPYSLSHNSVKAIVEDQKGNLWLGLGVGGKSVNRYDPESGRFYHVENTPEVFENLICGSVNHIIVDSRGGLWIGLWNEGMIYYHPETGHTQRFHSGSSALTDDIVRSLCFFNNTLWIGTWTDGLYQWEKPQESGPLQYQGQKVEGVADEGIRCLMTDHSGMLWIGTNGRGVQGINLNAKPFQNITQESCPCIQKANGYAMAEDETGQWFGFRGSGLVCREAENGKFVPFSNQKYGLHNSILSLAVDSGGSLWIGTDGEGLNRLHLSSKKMVRFKSDAMNPAALSNNSVHCLYIDHENTVWAGTWGGGLNRYNRGTGGFDHFDVDEQVAGRNVVVSLFEDSENRLWTGTSRKGVFIFDKEAEEFQQFPEQDTLGLHASYITSILQTDSVLWFGTGGNGLIASYGNGRFDRYTEKDGLAHDFVSGLAGDTHDCLWISTENGLSRLHLPSSRFQNYDKRDGLGSTTFNSGAVFKSRTMGLCFGGTEGFTCFNPEDIHTDTTRAPVKITSLHLFNKPVQIGEVYDHYPVLTSAVDQTDQIRVSDKHRSLSFEFAALHYVLPQRNQYAYRLKGFEKKWTYTSANRRYATYTNLKPGHYVFEVRGSNSDGIWNQSAATMRIEVIPPFWQKAWFRVLFLFGAALSLFLIFQIRMRVLRANNRRLESLVEERTEKLQSAQKQLIVQERMAALGQIIATVAHEIRNPLGTIRAAVFTIAETRKNPDQNRFNQAVARAEKNVARCDSIITELLDFTRNRELNLKRADIDTWMKRLVQELNVPEEIRVEPRFNSAALVDFDKENMRRVIINIADNAIQALQTEKDEDGTEKPTLVFSTKVVSKYVEIRISDNGPGVEEEIKKQMMEPLFSTKTYGIGLGLSIVQKIMKQHQGTLEIIHNDPGVTVVLRLPLPEDRL